MSVTIEKSGVVNNLPKSLVSSVLHNIGNLHKHVSKLPPARLLDLAKLDFSIVLVCQEHGHRVGAKCNFTENLQMWYGNNWNEEEAVFPLPLTDQQKSMIDFLVGEVYDCLIVLSQDSLQTFRDEFPTIFMMASVYAFRHEMATLEMV